MINSRAPDANIVFFPFTEEDTDFGDLDSSKKIEVEEIPAGKDIISIKTTKPKGAAGQFSCVLGSAQNWKRMIQPGCWCLIYMKDAQLKGDETAELDSGLKMVGIVKTVRRVEELDRNSGVRTVRYLVGGEDFHSVFKSPIYLNVNLNEIAKDGSDVSIAQALVLLNTKFGDALTPSEMVKALVDSLLGRPAFNADKSGQKVSEQAFASRGGQPYLVPEEVSKRVLGFESSGAAQNLFTGLVTFFLQPDLVGTIKLQSDLGRLVDTWSLIETYCHKLLNEVYTDLLPVNVPSAGLTKTRLTPSIVLRSIPFAKDKSIDTSLISMQDAQSLTIHSRRSGVAEPGTKVGDVPAGTGAHFYISKEISESDIIAFSSGKSDAERFNLFFIPPNVGFGDQQRNAASFMRNIINQVGGKFENIGDKISISRYGLRPWISFSDYMLADPDTTIGLVNEIVQDSWASAYLFENGQVLIPGSGSHIPVGTNIEFVDRGWIAHVEQVDHEFQVNPSTGHKSYLTTISFVRLQNKDDGTPVDLVTDDADTDGQLDDEWDRGLSIV